MKKAISLLLAAAVLLCFSACGSGNDATTAPSTTAPATQPTTAAPATTAAPETTAAPTEPPATPLSFDKANTADGYAEFAISKIYTTDKVTPPILSGVHLSWEAGADSTYIVVVTEIKNLQSASVAADKALTVLLAVHGSSNVFAATCVVEEDDGTALARGNQRSIGALSTARVYYMFEVPKSAAEGEVGLVISAGSENFSGKTDLAQYEQSKQTFAVGETITVDDVLSVTIDKIYFSSVLNPPKPGRYYTYWEAASGKSYLIVKVTAKNLKGSDLKYDTIAGVSCVYNEKYNYSSFCVLETDGGSNLNGYPSQYIIPPLDTGICYYLMEVPAEVEQGAVEIEMYIAGEYYYHTLG